MIYGIRCHIKTKNQHTWCKKWIDGATCDHEYTDINEAYKALPRWIECDTKCDYWVADYVPDTDSKRYIEDNKESK